MVTTIANPPSHVAVVLAGVSMMSSGGLGFSAPHCLRLRAGVSTGVRDPDRRSGCRPAVAGCSQRGCEGVVRRGVAGVCGTQVIAAVVHAVHKGSCHWFDTHSSAPGAAGLEAGEVPIDDQCVTARVGRVTPLPVGVATQRQSRTMCPARPGRP